MFDTARLGFILVGLHVTLSGVFSALSSAFQYTSSNSEMLLFQIGGSVVVAIVVAVPGLYLVVRNEQLARRAFPSAGPGELSTESLVVAGIAIAGLWLLVSSGISLAVGIVSLLMNALSSDLHGYMTAVSVRSLVSGVVGIAIGIFLFRSPRSVARRVGFHPPR